MLQLCLQYFAKILVVMLRLLEQTRRLLPNLIHYGIVEATWKLPDVREEAKPTRRVCQSSTELHMTANAHQHNKYRVSDYLIRASQDGLS